MDALCLKVAICLELFSHMNTKFPGTFLDGGLFGTRVCANIFSSVTCRSIITISELRPFQGALNPFGVQPNLIGRPYLPYHRKGLRESWLPLYARPDKYPMKWLNSTRASAISLKDIVLQLSSIVWHCLLFRLTCS